jgi:hypothetical protein
MWQSSCSILSRMAKRDLPNFSIPARILVGAVALVMIYVMLHYWLGISFWK